ncbi:hypothetical protein ACLMAL_35550 [Nocardia sp. CWNU-33]
MVDLAIGEPPLLSDRYAAGADDVKDAGFSELPLGGEAFGR